MSDFYDWYFEQRYLGIEAIDHARAAFEAGQQSRQKEIDELQEMIDEALNTSDEFYSFGDGESCMAFCNEIINILRGRRE